MSPPPLYVVTVWQPWASAIVLAGKDVENRTRAPWPRLIGQRVAVHAGLRVDARYEAAARRWMARLGVELPEVLPRGRVLGVTTLTGTSDKAPWYMEGVGWGLSDTVALPEPTEVVRGHHYFWTLPEPLAVYVRGLDPFAHGRPDAPQASL